jgi:DNA-binding GntR family transcriptional regulator
VIAKPAKAARAERPAHARIYDRLRELVLFGDLAPGASVTIQGLSARLGAGATPVREAIRRLISDGALEFQGNRRVCVPRLDAVEIEQLIFLRLAVETELARRAAEAAGPDLIVRMEQADADLDAAIAAGDTNGYLASNHRFHALLHQAAGAPLIAEMAGRLWLRFGPSMRIVCGRLGTANLPDRHKDLLDALRRRDAEAAAQAVDRDIREGMAQIAALISMAP